MQYEDIGGAILCCTRYRKLTKVLSLDNRLELLAFPDIFPYGNGAFHATTCEENITIIKLLQPKIVKYRWQVCTEHRVSVVWPVCNRLNQVNGSMSLALRLKKGRRFHTITGTAGMPYITFAQNVVPCKHAERVLQTVQSMPPYW